MIKELICIALFLLINAGSVIGLARLWRYRGRAGRAAGVVGIAAAYVILTYLISLAAAKGGWPEGMPFMMAVMFVGVPAVVAFAVLLILAVFGPGRTPRRRVGMIVSFAVLAVIIASLIFSKHLRLVRYSVDMDDPDPQKRGYAVLMIGGTGLRSAEPMILSAARDKDPTVRKNALLALCTIDDPGTLEVVRAALSDVDAGVRETAVITVVPLGRGGPQVISDLKRMLGDPDPNVREAAAGGLDSLEPGWRAAPDAPVEYR
jgi:hypothetical protein